MVFLPLTPSSGKNGRKAIEGIKVRFRAIEVSSKKSHTRKSHFFQGHTGKKLFGFGEEGGAESDERQAVEREGPVETNFYGAGVNLGRWLYWAFGWGRRKE
jgi:hypothetical protein